MSSTEFWTNDDGLNIRFGNEKGKSLNQGRVSTAGDEQELVVNINYENVGSAAAVIGTYPGAGVPDGARIESASLYVNTAFTSAGAATLTLGMFNDDGDGTFSANDADGIDAAIAITAIDAVGDKIACDGALVGAVLAGTGDRPLYVSGNYGTAVFTAGDADLVIKYRN